MAGQTKLFNEIRKFLVFFAVLGLWPAWSKSNFKTLFLIILILYNFYIFYIFWSAFYFNLELPYHSLAVIVQHLYLTGILLTHFTIIIEAFVNRNAQMRLIDKISYADQLFHSKLQLKMSYRNEKNTILIRFAGIISILMIIRSICTINLYYEYSINTFPYRLMFSAWIIQLRSIQVVFFVYSLRIRLQCVSDQLKEMLTSANFCPANGINSHNRICIFVVDMPLAKRSFYDRLVHLKQIYGELYEICELINVTFGWSLLTIIVQSLIEFISSFYWFYLAIQEPIFLLAIICLVDLLPIIAIVVSIAYICSSCAHWVSLIWMDFLNEWKPINIAFCVYLDSIFGKRFASNHAG